MAPRSSITDEQYIIGQLLACGHAITFNVHEVAKNTGSSATAVKSKLSAIKKRTGLNIKTTVSGPPQVEVATVQNVGGKGKRDEKKNRGKSGSVTAETAAIPARALSTKRVAKKYLNYAEEDSDVDEEWEETVMDENEEEEREVTEVKSAQVKKYRRNASTLRGPREAADAAAGTNRLLAAVLPLKRQRQAGMVEAAEDETESDAELVEVDSVNGDAEVEQSRYGEQGKLKIADSEEPEEHGVPENDSGLLVSAEHKRLFDSIVGATKKEPNEKAVDVDFKDADNDDEQPTSSLLTEVSETFETPVYFLEQIIQANVDGVDLAAGTKRAHCISPDSSDSVKKPRLVSHEETAHESVTGRNPLDAMGSFGDGVADASSENEVAQDGYVEPKLLQSPQPNAGSV